MKKFVFRTFWGSFLFLFIFSSFAFSKETPSQTERHVIYITDWDKTVVQGEQSTAAEGFNTPYVVVRVPQPPHPLTADLSKFPEELEIPVYDFEKSADVNNTDVKSLLARPDGRGGFILGHQKEIELSNGSKIIPGYYYIDPRVTFRNFRSDTEEDRKKFIESFKAVSQKDVKKWAMPYFNLLQYALSSEGRVIVLTARGNEPEDWEKGFELWKKAGLVSRTPLDTIREAAPDAAPDRAYVNLSHPSQIRFWRYGGLTGGRMAEAKTRYILRVLETFSEVRLKDGVTPHALIFAENDQKYLNRVRDAILEFQRRRTGRYPVDVFLVNAGEDEELAEPIPYRARLGRNVQLPTETRVQLLTPTGDLKIFNDAIHLETVLSEAWKISMSEAREMLKSAEKSAKGCADWLAANAQKGGRK